MCHLDHVKGEGYLGLGLGIVLKPGLELALGLWLGLGPSLRLGLELALGLGLGPGLGLAKGWALALGMGPTLGLGLEPSLGTGTETYRRKGNRDPDTIFHFQIWTHKLTQKHCTLHIFGADKLKKKASAVIWLQCFYKNIRYFGLTHPAVSPEAT